MYHSHAPTKIFGCGSSTLKTFLPESDLDLILITPSFACAETKLLLEVFEALYQTMTTGLEDSPGSELSSSQKGLGLAARCLQPIIRNLQVINARTKVISGLVNNISMDITINQINGLASITFLEEIDQAIGDNHLFKRSVLLIKVRTSNSCSLRI